MNENDELFEIHSREMSDIRIMDKVPTLPHHEPANRIGTRARDIHRASDPVMRVSSESKTVSVNINIKVFERGQIVSELRRLSAQ